MAGVTGDVAARLAGIETRIGAAWRSAGRARASVRLVGASKLPPVEARATAYEAGLMEVRDMAEPSTPVAGTPFFDLERP